MIKKWAVAFCLCLLSGTVLFGCGDLSEKPAVRPKAFTQAQYEWGEVSGQTIVIWGDATNVDRLYYRRLFERYHQLTGNTLRIEKLSKRQMEAFKAGEFSLQGMNMPDILLSHGGANLDGLSVADFYDFTNAPWVDDLTGRAINQAIYQGRVIGLPFGEASVSGTLYNKEIFRKNNLLPPRTQAEFFAVCEKLLAKGIVPVYLPYAEVSMLLYQFPMDGLLQKDSVLQHLNDGTLSYARIPEMKKIVSWYKTMAEHGYFGDGYESNDWAGMDEAMRSEKYAMMLCWDTWLYTDFTGDASRFGIMPAFMGTPEQGTFEGPNLELFLVHKNSPRLEAAIDFIRFAADPYNYNAVFEGIYTAPVFKKQIGSVTTPQYMESERFIEQFFHDSTAWLRVEGFSQMDAVYIQKHMKDSAYRVEDCLRDMDEAREKRKVR